MLDLVERRAAQPVETADPMAPGAACRKEDEPLVGNAMLSGGFERCVARLWSAFTLEIEPRADDPG
jgi:hypothetical protein